MGTVTRQWEVREMSEGGKSILFKKTIVKNGDRGERDIYILLWDFSFSLELVKRYGVLQNLTRNPCHSLAFKRQNKEGVCYVVLDTYLKSNFVLGV